MVGEMKIHTSKVAVNLNAQIINMRRSRSQSPPAIMETAIQRRSRKELLL